MRKVNAVTVAQEILLGNAMFTNVTVAGLGE
jgi:hypothetical protein